MIPLRLYLIGGALLLVLIAGGVIVHKIYKSGQDAVRIQQERNLQELRNKTDAAKDRALTTDDPRGELREDSRPNK